MMGNKSKKNSRLFVLSLITISLLFIQNARADECGVLKLLNNRSSGVSVKVNECTGSYLSMGAVVDVAANGRLWVKSNPSKLQGEGFQMICQNRTSDSLTLEFSDMFLPWVSASKLNNCSGWVNNKLSCDGVKGEIKAVSCVLAFIKKPKENKADAIERTTSVKMRDLSSFLNAAKILKEANKKEFLDHISQELKLCKILNSDDNNYVVVWDVDSDQHLKSFTLVAEKGKVNSALSECAEAVINSSLKLEISTHESYKSEF